MLNARCDHLQADIFEFRIKLNLSTRYCHLVRGNKATISETITSASLFLRRFSNSRLVVFILLYASIHNNDL